VGRPTRLGFHLATGNYIPDFLEVNPGDQKLIVHLSLLLPELAWQLWL